MKAVITGINEALEVMEYTNRIKKAEREIKKQRVAELIAEGVDPEIAKVMIDTFAAYNL